MHVIIYFFLDHTQLDLVIFEVFDHLLLLGPNVLQLSTYPVIFGGLGNMLQFFIVVYFAEASYFLLFSLI